MPRWPAVRAVGEHANGPRMSSSSGISSSPGSMAGRRRRRLRASVFVSSDEEVAAADAARIALRIDGGGVGPERRCNMESRRAGDVPPGPGRVGRRAPRSRRDDGAIVAWTVIDPGPPRQRSASRPPGVDLGTWAPGSGPLEAPGGTAWRIQVPGRLRVRVVSGSPDRRRDPSADTRLRVGFRFAAGAPAFSKPSRSVGDAPVDQPSRWSRCGRCRTSAARPRNRRARTRRQPRPARLDPVEPRRHAADLPAAPPGVLAAGSVIALRSKDAAVRATLGDRKALTGLSLLLDFGLVRHVQGQSG